MGFSAILLVKMVFVQNAVAMLLVRLMVYATKQLGSVIVMKVFEDESAINVNQVM